MTEERMIELDYYPSITSNELMHQLMIFSCYYYHNGKENWKLCTFCRRNTSPPMYELAWKKIKLEYDNYQCT